MIQEVLQFDKSHHLDLNFSIQNAAFLDSHPFDLDFQNTWNQILTWVIVSYWERFAKGI